jgi:hypothetical protein
MYWRSSDSALSNPALSIRGRTSIIWCRTSDDCSSGSVISRRDTFHVFRKWSHFINGGEGFRLQKSGTRHDAAPFGTRPKDALAALRHKNSTGKIPVDKKWISSKYQNACQGIDKHSQDNAGANRVPLNVHHFDSL